ncbi:MAG: DUF4926 domain-containing protein [Cyclobacteriaceae bacterium]
MKELDLIALTEAIPAKSLEQGDVGTIVATYESGKGYEVEFTTYTGETIAVITVKPHQIRPLGAKELMSARSLS